MHFVEDKHIHIHMATSRYFIQKKDNVTDAMPFLKLRTVAVTIGECSIKDGSEVMTVITKLVNQKKKSLCKILFTFLLLLSVQ